MRQIEDVTLPNALMMGVDYELFWTLNPKSLSPFIKAFSLKQKYDDATAWRNGLYIRLAVASCFNKSAKYPTKPMSHNGEDENRPMTAEEIKSRMMATANRINSQLRKED